jgi:hypothetical protein
VTWFTYSTFRHWPKFCVTPSKFSTFGREISEISSFLRAQTIFPVHVTPGTFDKGPCDAWPRPNFDINTRVRDAWLSIWSKLFGNCTVFYVRSKPVSAPASRLKIPCGARECHVFRRRLDPNLTVFGIRFPAFAWITNHMTYQKSCALCVPISTLTLQNKCHLAFL